MSSNKEGLFTVYFIFCQPTLISECKTTLVHRNCYKMSHSHEKDEARNRTIGGGNELSTFFDKTRRSVMAITFCSCYYLAFLLNDLFICQTAKNPHVLVLISYSICFWNYWQGQVANEFFLIFESSPWDKFCLLVQAE